MSFSIVLNTANKFIALFIAHLVTVGRSVPKPSTSPKAVEKYRKLVAAEGSQIQISFLENGNHKGQLYVMVHGTPGSSSGWADYVANPPPNSKVIAIDRLGFGNSTTTKSFPKLKDHVAAICQIIPPGETDIVLVGHSLGGPIVAQYAAEHPDQIQSVIFLAASVDPSQEKIHLIQHFANWGIIRNFLPKFIRNANEELIALKAELEELKPKLGQIKAKVFIVHGDRDKLVPVDNVQFLQTHLNSAKLIETIVIPKQNHFLPWNEQATVRKTMQMASDKNFDSSEK